MKIVFDTGYYNKVSVRKRVFCVMVKETPYQEVTKQQEFYKEKKTDI